MTDPTFTILMPVVRPPALMPFAIASILAQTRGDFELFIIGDGAPSATIAEAEQAASRDKRIRVFPFPKGLRHGEAHRHTVLQEARGRYVCQLADDDLWFPEYLDEMAMLLAEFEFGNLLHAYIKPNDVVGVYFADLADPAIRDRMMTQSFNNTGPSNVGYHLATYRRLPQGWSPAPHDVLTDLAMWRKFLALPGIAAGTRFAVASVTFPAPLRKNWSLEQRHEEIARHAQRLSSPQQRDGLRQLAFRQAARGWMDREHRIAEWYEPELERLGREAEYANELRHLADARAVTAAEKIGLCNREIQALRHEIEQTREMADLAETRAVRAVEETEFCNQQMEILRRSLTFRLREFCLRVGAGSAIKSVARLWGGPAIRK